MATVRKIADGFILEEEGLPLGGVGFEVSPTCPPEFLADLPPEELYIRDPASYPYCMR